MPKENNGKTSNGKTTKVKKFDASSVTLNALNPCRPVVNNQPSRRAFFADALIEGGNFKTCWERAAVRWGKVQGLDADAAKERYSELMPSTPYAAKYVLDVVVAANAKRDVPFSYTLDEESGTVSISSTKKSKKKK